MYAHGETLAAVNGPFPRVVLLVGDPGSGVEYLAAVLTACQDTIVSTRAFAPEVDTRVAAIGEMVTAFTDDEFQPTAYILPDLSRNFLQTMSQVCRETAGLCQGIAVVVGQRVADELEWFGDAAEGLLRSLTVLHVHRNPVWAAAQVAWGDRSPASRVSVFVDPTKVTTAAEVNVWLSRASRRSPRRRFVWSCDDAWDAYRGVRGKREELLTSVGFPSLVAEVSRCNPPLSGELKRWVSNAASFHGA